MSRIVAQGAGFDRPALDTQLRRFDRRFRRRLRKLAKTSNRFTDLIYSFPAAAFVIAGGHGNPMAIGQASIKVKEGANLREIGDTLGLPIWLRRLPPEAFTTGFGQVPGSERFNKRIVNLIPKDSAETANWFTWVRFAQAVCHEDFALWLARQDIWDEVENDPKLLLPLAAFVWFADAEGTPARGLIAKPWKSDLSFTKAVTEARSWFMNILLEYCRDGNGHKGRWFVEQRVSGYRIVPLRTTKALKLEGDAMNNCVADYAHKVVIGECLIYSIRRGNNHVATLEIRPHHKMGGQPVVVQLLGPDNDEVSDNLERAVDKWLGRQGLYPFLASANFALAGFDQYRWQRLWGPFWDHMDTNKAGGERASARQPMAMHKALESLSFYG